MNNNTTTIRKACGCCDSPMQCSCCGKCQTCGVDHWAHLRPNPFARPAPQPFVPTMPDWDPYRITCGETVAGSFGQSFDNFTGRPTGGCPTTLGECFTTTTG